MPAQESDFQHFGIHRLDRMRQQLWAGAVPVPLRPKTWDLLLYLVARPGMLVSTEALITALWPEGEVTPKALTNRIVELRRALGDDPNQPTLIQTVHRRGYRWMVPVRSGDAAADEAAAPAEPGPGEAAEGGAVEPMSADADAAATAHAPAALAGRQPEQAVLARRWALAGQGQRQVVLLSGPSGIGKTVLADAFARGVLAPDATALPRQPRRPGRPGQRVDGPLVGRGACLAQSAEHEAFGPLLALVADLAAGPDEALVVPLLRRCAPTWLLQLPWLTEADEAAQWRRQLAGAGTGRMLREGCAFFELLAQQRPLLLLLDDLHWADPASIDLLDQLAQGRRPARLMVLGTLQTALATQDGHPVMARSRRLLAQGLLDELNLGPLALPEVQAHLALRFGSDELARALAPRLMKACDGHPLLMAAMLDHLIGGGHLRQAGPDWALADGSDAALARVPEAFRQLIMAGLARLGADERALLEAASVVGQQVPAQALAAALGRDVVEVEKAGGALAQRLGWWRPIPARAWPDGSLAGCWGFEHETHRRVLHDQLAPAGRQALHRRVAERVAQGWGSRIAEVAGPLAVAYEQARLHAESARMLALQAGVCAQRFAYAEAVEAIEAALAQLAQLPPSADRDRTEAQLQLHLGNLLTACDGLGHARGLQAYRVAEALSGRLDDVVAGVRARLGETIQLILIGQVSAAVQSAQSMVALAEARQASLLAAACAYAGLAALSADRPLLALGHFDRALLLVPEPGVPAMIDVHALAAMQRVRCLLALGRQDQARQALEQALDHARRCCVPIDLLHQLYWAADSLARLGEADQALALLAEMIAMAETLAHANLLALGEVLRLSLTPPLDRDLDRMAALVRQSVGTGGHWFNARLLAQLADAQLDAGNAQAAADLLVRAEAAAADVPVFAADVAAVQRRLAARRQ